jgi:hypothetical protein
MLPYIPKNFFRGFLKSLQQKIPKNWILGGIVFLSFSVLFALFFHLNAKLVSIQAQFENNTLLIENEMTNRQVEKITANEVLENYGAGTINPPVDGPAIPRYYEITSGPPEFLGGSGPPPTGTQIGEEPTYDRYHDGCLIPSDISDCLLIERNDLNFDYFSFKGDYCVCLNGRAYLIDGEIEFIAFVIAIIICFVGIYFLLLSLSLLRFSGGNWGYESQFLFVVITTGLLIAFYVYHFRSIFGDYHIFDKYDIYFVDLLIYFPHIFIPYLVSMAILVNLFALILFFGALQNLPYKLASDRDEYLNSQDARDEKELHIESKIDLIERRITKGKKNALAGIVFSSITLLAAIATLIMFAISMK